MIRPAQLKLLERARAAVAPEADDFAEALRRWGGVDQVEELTAASYERLMDHFTVCGLRDRRRPVLSHRTFLILDAMREDLGWSDNTFKTVLRSDGIGDFGVLDGQKLLFFLANREGSGLKLETFNNWRRQVTAAQLRLLQLARKKIEQPDSRYYPMLQVFGAVNSATDLDRRGFTLMLAALERDGFERAPVAHSAAGFGRRPGFASPEQVELIRTLWRDWSGPTPVSDAAIEGALNAWLERYHHTSSLRFLTTGGAGKVITALKAMTARKGAKAREVSHA